MPLVLGGGTVLAADLYRCPGRDGTPVYSDRSCGKDAEVVGSVPDQPSVTVQPHTGNDVNVNVEVNNNVQLSTPPPAAPVRESRGLPFELYRRLDRGMSEGEILAIAGAPERETVDAVNTRDGIQTKSYYYVSEGRNASITRIQFTNGTVTRIDRKLPPY
jgi:hypothetical protein